MLSKSFVKFSEEGKLGIDFEINKLDTATIQSIKEIRQGKENKVIIDVEKFYIANRNEEYLITLVYNLERVDEKFACMTKNNCMVSTEELGFLIAPIIKVHKDAIINCYESVKKDQYKCYWDFDKFEFGFVRLMIEWN